MRRSHYDNTIDFWNTRSKCFNRLEWARSRSYLRHVVGIIDPGDDDTILDLGAGTGLLTSALAEAGGRVYGVDISLDMLSEACDSSPYPIYVAGDIRHLPFRSSTFDKLTARLTLHHITSDISGVMDECHRVLRDGGRLYVSEGVPPSVELRDWYTSMFELKERRITLMEGDTVDLMEGSNFDVISSSSYIMESCSIRNWLNNANLSEDAYSAIYDLHIELSSEGKASYNMRITGDDILIDMKFVTVIGRKS